jgi:hypothetical protein
MVVVWLSTWPRTVLYMPNDGAKKAGLHQNHQGGDVWGYEELHLGIVGHKRGALEGKGYTSPVGETQWARTICRSHE